MDVCSKEKLVKKAYSVKIEWEKILRNDIYDLLSRHANSISVPFDFIFFPFLSVMACMARMSVVTVTEIEHEEDGFPCNI